MTLPAGSQIFNDVNASGGEAVVFLNNGTATKNITFTSSMSKVTVRAEANVCSGSPRMNVKLDGISIFNSLISQTSWTDFNITHTTSSGTHKLSIVYNNDFANGICDRNLRVDKVTFTP